MDIFIGIDWSEQNHSVVFMNPAGAVLALFEMEHSQEGFHKLEQIRQKLGLALDQCVVGLETAHNLLIDFLWSQGYPRIFVVPPSVVKANRGRYGANQASSDPADADLIAEILRTDRGRLYPWHPDKLLTRQMRAKLSLILHLSKNTVRYTNRLRSVLLRYYPAALQVFKGGLDSQISLHFLLKYPTPQAAAKLSYKELLEFTQEHAYPQAKVPGCLDRLQADYPLSSPETVSIFQSEAVLLARLLLETKQTELQERRALTSLFGQHPDYAIFQSLPGTGKFLAPALCAKFGDDRARFPTAAGVQALAGTCPVTRKSGKQKQVLFRHGCDREWRDISQQWARALITCNSSPIATAYFEAILGHSHSTSHALRCLANRWLAVA